MLRGATRGTETATPEISKWLLDGIISTIGDGVAIAVPVAEQIGQTCESSEREFRSTQQCNCAAKRMLPRSINRKQACFNWLGISPGFCGLKTPRYYNLGRRRVAG